MYKTLGSTHITRYTYTHKHMSTGNLMYIPKQLNVYSTTHTYTHMRIGSVTHTPKQSHIAQGCVRTLACLSLLYYLSNLLSLGHSVRCNMKVTK